MNVERPGIEVATSGPLVQRPTCRTTTLLSLLQLSEASQRPSNLPFLLNILFVTALNTPATQNHNLHKLGCYILYRTGNLARDTPDFERTVCRRNVELGYSFIYC